MTTETLTPPAQPVFPNTKVSTNMPFFDGTTLVFGQSSGPISAMIPTTGAIWKRIRQNKALAERMKNLPREQKVTHRPWKLAWCNWSDKIINPITTGFPANVAERAPVFYREGDQIHLSFIAGGPTSAGFHYRLYTCSGPDLAHLSSPQLVSHNPLYFGFISPHHVCTGMMNVIQLTEKATGNSFRLQVELFRVCSVNFLAADPAKLLITGLVDQEFNCHTILYDLATENVSDVSVGGPVYKASLYDNQLIFAEKQNNEFEERKLCQGEVSLSPSTIKITRK